MFGRRTDYRQVADFGYCGSTRFLRLHCPWVRFVAGFLAMPRDCRSVHPWARRAVRVAVCSYAGIHALSFRLVGGASRRTGAMAQLHTKEYILFEPPHALQPDYLDALDCLLESTRRLERNDTSALWHLRACISWLERNTRHCQASREAMEEWSEQEVELTEDIEVS
jgi:hypothetical protein